VEDLSLPAQDIVQSREYKRTEARLRELFETIRVGPKRGALFPTPYEVFTKHCRDFYDKWREAQSISRILRELKTRVEYPNSKAEAMTKMLAYMGLVESIGVTLIDMVLIVLIANKREVHTRGPSTKHVTSFEQLGKLDLSYKMDFLKAEDIPLFAVFINREIRNVIAHLKFFVDGNGKIWRRTKRRSYPIDIDDAIAKFWEGVEAIEGIFEKIRLLEYLEKVQRRSSASLSSSFKVGKVNTTS